MLAGVLFGGAALLPAISEGRGQGPGRGGRCGQSQCRQVSQNCPQDGQRLRDGSGGNTNCPQTKQDCRGPADCPGNQGAVQGGGADSGTKQ